MADDPLRGLREEYLEGARSRVAELPALVVAAPSDPPAALGRIRLLAHNLRGSGGFYGFWAISGAAAALEERVVAALEGSPLGLEELGALADALVSAVREGQVAN